MPAAPPKAIIFVANHGNDPTEVAVPWSELKAGGCAVTFATEHGDIAAADPVTVQQTLFACVLGATSTATSTYRDMLASAEFNNPLSWSDEGFDILGYGWLPPHLPRTEREGKTETHRLPKMLRCAGFSFFPFPTIR